MPEVNIVYILPLKLNSNSRTGFPVLQVNRAICYTQLFIPAVTIVGEQICRGHMKSMKMKMNFIWLKELLAEIHVGEGEL